MSVESGLIPLIVTILGVGVAAQLLADRMNIPSVLFLLLAGIAVGPEGLGLVTPTTFGDSLSALVGLSVAIIIFESAFHLTTEKLRQTPHEVVRLVTVGALITLCGTATVVRFALGLAWDISFLVGSVLVATGPTVITPILDVVPVRDRVAAALETEGLINDVTAAILAIVMFEFVVLKDRTTGELVGSFIIRLGVGLLIGLLVAGVLWYLLQHTDLSTDNAVQYSRLLVLVGALTAYGAAEAFVAGTGITAVGIAAVATVGLLLGNADLPYEDDIAAFKGDITLVVLSFVFIVFAALLSFEDLLALGLGGLLVVLVVGVILRPLIVMLCTTGDRFTRREQLFMSAAAPRGIIPASVATLFVIELQPVTPTAATALIGTVFLVILTTVVIEGGFARHIAYILNIIPMRVIIVGGGRVGRGLAERLEDRGENVVLIDQDQSMVEIARNAGFTVHHGDGTDVDVLSAAGADNAKIVAAATGDDDANLLVAQLAEAKFDVETVIARVNTPSNVEAFEEVGVRAISADQSISWAMDNVIERPTLSNWMTELGRSGDVQEIEVTADELVGMSIHDLDQEFPDGVLIALVGRDGEAQMPNPDFTLQHGDHITFLGRTEAVREAIKQCHPELSTA